MPRYNHDQHYRGRVVTAVGGRATALDVGCGDGSLARELRAAGVPWVTGIDADARMVAQARLDASGTPAIGFVHDDFLRHDFGPARFDAITCVAAVHEMPFNDAVAKMVWLLRPGGVLVILGRYRPRTLVDHAVNLAATPVNAYFALRRGWSGGPSGGGSARTVPPVMTLRDVRDESVILTPGASVRRLLLWRYLLTWRKT